MTLFRNIGVIMKDTTEVRGDWMVALETGHRIVVWFYKRDSEQVVEMIYDEHIAATRSVLGCATPRDSGIRLPPY